MMTSSTYAIEPTVWRTPAFLQHVLDGLPDPIFVKDAHHRIVAGNAAICTLTGYPHDQLIGKSDYDLFPLEQAQHFDRIDTAIIATHQPYTTEELLTDASGQTHVLWTRKVPLYAADGQVVGVCGVITDITAIQQRETRVAQLEAQLTAQQAQLEELGVPVIQLWTGVLLLPLLGSIDDQRAARITAALLETVLRTHAAVVLIDVTGVPIIDTAIASHLMRTVQAVQLLGGQSVLVGIRPELAQTLVSLGIDFGELRTRATLQQGLEYALTTLNYHVQHRPNWRRRLIVRHRLRVAKHIVVHAASDITGVLSPQLVHVPSVYSVTYQALVQRGKAVARDEAPFAPAFPTCMLITCSRSQRA